MALSGGRDRPIPIVELGVAEAYEILVHDLGVTDLPPLEAIENEDWGRDTLLSRFLDVPPEALAALGLTWDAGGLPPDDPEALEHSGPEPG